MPFRSRRKMYFSITEVVLGRLAFSPSAARFGCPCIGVEMAEKWYTIAENNRLSFVSEDADIHFILDTADPLRSRRPCHVHLLF